jgi:predicted nuclease of predicted toxin-antitoxin system
MMRLLANENFPGDAVEALRALGHDVAWIRTDAPGSTDIDVMARASRDDRILVTLDKDFGELAFRNQLETCSGIVLLRVFPPIPARVTALATQVFESGRDFSRLFVVAEVGRIRERPLPNLARGKPPQ